jgi:hypothetical protein
MAWIGHMGAARQFALEGKFEEGRAEFAAAERLPGDHGEPFHLLARKAIFEYKAGDTALGQRLVEEAIGTLEEPAPALLVLLVEAARYDLPYRLGGIVADLEYRWQRILKHKKNGKTAGRFCRTMLGLLMGRIDYPGRSTHLEQVRGYVDRCGRVRWEADDLRAVCMFLKALPKENRSSSTLGRLRKLVRQGYRKFPEAPDFPYMMGCLEIEKGPERCDRWRARHHFERARDLAAKSGPKYASIVEDVERKLAFLAEVGMLPWARASAMRGNRREEDFDEDTPEDDDAFGDFPGGGLLAAFTRMCESMGLDPEKVLEDIAERGPVRFPHPGPDRERKEERNR